MQHITISCVIPTLGRGRILCDTINMLLDQSCEAHEIIVVDQTPVPDEATEQALRAFDKKGAIRWLHQTEPNASKARNAGALAATGDVVLFLDDDIRVKPDFLAAYVETFARTEAIAVAGQILEGQGETVDELPSRAFDQQIGWLYFRPNYNRECKTSFMMSGNVAIQRSIFLRLGGMDENYERGAYREESDFAQRFLLAGYQFIFQPRASLYHLGYIGAPEGGSRNWIRNKRIFGFHHCVGDWYFNLHYARGRMFVPLFGRSLRGFVVTRYSVFRPWWIPILLVRWLLAFPSAVRKRMRGPVLITARHEWQSTIPV